MLLLSVLSIRNYCRKGMPELCSVFLPPPARFFYNLIFPHRYLPISSFGVQIVGKS